jgi:hypothetical protein
MGILEHLPPQLLTFLTWLVLWGSASTLILIVSVGVGKILGEFIADILGWIR